MKIFSKAVLLIILALSLVWHFVISARATERAAAPAKISQKTQKNKSLEGEPRWLIRIIKKFKNSPDAKTPMTITKYKYKGQTVYFFEANCCDQINTLYDAKGAVVCATGGRSGRGDGKCLDFYEERKNGAVVWKNKRK
ncbi:MAG: DUF6970 domain-containing protein [Pyrinomonadaceae bacterium]